MSGLLLQDVSKTFGTKTVVDHLSLEITHPSVYGLLGTNGAGKTTTIRMILGIITKNSGKITWHGQPVSRKSVNFGYLPEERGIYPKIKIIDQLLYFATLKGLDEATARSAIQKYAKKLKVTEYFNLPAEKLSKGNQQKIQFMTAIIHNPDLIVLDEPFSGLDPVNTEILRNLIVELVDQGKYIIMSAHQMPTIEEFCSDILILDHGKTVLQGNLQDIKANYPANRLQIDADQDITKFLKSAHLQLENHKNHQYTIKIPDEAAAHQLLRTLVDQNITIDRFEIMKPTLNDIFIEKVEG